MYSTLTLILLLLVVVPLSLRAAAGIFEFTVLVPRLYPNMEREERELVRTHVRGAWIGLLGAGAALCGYYLVVHGIVPLVSWVLLAGGLAALYAGFRRTPCLGVTGIWSGRRAGVRPQPPSVATRRTGRASEVPQHIEGFLATLPSNDIVQLTIEAKTFGPGLLLGCGPGDALPFVSVSEADTGGKRFHRTKSLAIILGAEGVSQDAGPRDAALNLRFQDARVLVVFCERFFFEVCRVRPMRRLEFWLSVTTVGKRAAS